MAIENSPVAHVLVAVVELEVAVLKALVVSPVRCMVFGLNMVPNNEGRHSVEAEEVNRVLVQNIAREPAAHKLKR